MPSPAQVEEIERECLSKAKLLGHRMGRFRVLLYWDDCHIVACTRCWRTIVLDTESGQIKSHALENRCPGKSTV